MTDVSPHLDSEQRTTLARLSGHPMSHNIKWPQVLSLLEALGEVSLESKDRYSVKIGARTEVFRPPHHGSDLSAETIIQLRHFLVESP